MISRFKVLCLVVLTILPATAGVAYAADYEYPSNRSASAILPVGMIAGPHHRVRERVVSYGYMHRWTVESNFGTFEVTGDGALRKLINAINAIAALREAKKSDAFLTSVKQSAKAPFELGKKLITDPVDTISGIPKGVFRIFGNVAEGVTMKHDPSEDSRIKQILFVSSWKRDFASEHGVDVCSSNKLLQKELNSVGWAAAVAGLSISVAAAASSATVVLVGKNMRFANQLNNVLKEEPPPRLRLINEEKLLGTPRAQAIFITSYIHTPPQAFGKIMSVVKPRHAIGYHFWTWHDIYGETLEAVRQTYDGPLTLATDMTVWNVTDAQVVVREAITDENVAPTGTTQAYRRAKREPPSVAAKWISPDINAGKWPGYTPPPLPRR